MRCFNTLECNFAFGVIGEQINEAIEIATLTDRSVVFTFNGVKITVTKGSNPKEVYIDYYRMLRKEVYIDYYRMLHECN